MTTPRSTKNTVTRPVLKDDDLVFAAVAKIVAAQRRGTLSSQLQLLARPNLVSVSNQTERDTRWLQKVFPSHETNPGGMFRDRGTRRGQKNWDREEHKHLLRAKTGKPWLDFPPSVRYDLLVPHVHRNLFANAYVDPSGTKPTTPSWECRACGTKLTKTQARELGLIPLLVRKTK